GGSCREADSVLVVTVDADATVTGVTQLRAFVSNASMSSANVFPAQRSTADIGFPTRFSLTIPRARSGAIDVALDGCDSRGVTVANGAGSATLVPGGTASLAITLHPGPSSCGNGTLDPGEQCDDGNRISEGVCDFQCQVAGTGADGGARDGGAGAG